MAACCSWDCRSADWSECPWWNATNSSMVFPDFSGFFQQHDVLCHAIKTWHWCWRGLQIPQILVQLRICEMFYSKLFYGDLTHVVYRTSRIWRNMSFLSDPTISCRTWRIRWSSLGVVGHLAFLEVLIECCLHESVLVKQGEGHLHCPDVVKFHFEVCCPLFKLELEPFLSTNKHHTLTMSVMQNEQHP